MSKREREESEGVAPLTQARIFFLENADQSKFLMVEDEETGDVFMR
jgi:hypothetical protein